MLGLSTGESIALMTAAGTFISVIWSNFGKSRDTNLTHLVSERNRLDQRVAALESRLDQVEAELEAVKADHRTLLDFLRDVVSGYFPDLPAVVSRAQTLLARMGGGEKP